MSDVIAPKPTRNRVSVVYRKPEGRWVNSGKHEQTPRGRGDAARRVSLGKGLPGDADLPVRKWPALHACTKCAKVIKWEPAICLDCRLSSHILRPF